MPKKAIVARVLPVIAVAAVLAFSLFVGGKVSLNTKLVACVGYGYGYGYFPFAPLVTGVVPNNGPSTGGTTVTITGLGFCNFPSGVTFGGVPATGFVVNSDTSATAVSPAHAPGVVHVQVTTAGGTSNTTTLDQFTYGAFTSYFTWFDKASTGFVQDNIHLLNQSGNVAHIFVNGPNGQTFGPITLANATETYVSFAQGTIGGPVSINSDQFILASQRVQYNQSFNEVWAQAAGSAALVNYINWFDKASTGFLNDNIHLLNPGATPSTVAVSVQGGTPVVAVVQPGGSTYVTFPFGIIGGPVKIQVTAGPAVLASQRVQFQNTFNEVWASSAALASGSSFVNWFDKASTGFSNDNIHLLNPGLATVSVTVSEDGGLNSATVNVAAGAETYVTFPFGVIGGPVKILVNGPGAVLASQRVQYNQSFNEVWAEGPGFAVQNSNFIMWYDKASTGFAQDNIHLLNPGTATAFVTVTEGSTVLSAIVPADGESYVTFPQGTIGGPVKITVTTGPGILAAARVQYYQTFNEIWAAAS